MKTLLMMLFGLSLSSAAAQGAECPTKSDGRSLTGVAAFFDKETEIQGDRSDECGGYRIELPLNVAWLVCEYGPPGSTAPEDQRWVKVQPPKDVKRCVLEVKEVKQRPASAKLTCK